jgi:hypothetical protein
MNSIRRHLSYANVVATLALVFAMSGGALAASHYLITKTSQIKPSVLKKLKAPGATGPAGAAGAAGAPGAQGVVGNEGKQGSKGELGKNGATNVVVRFGEGTAANTAVGEATANCNAGERATGGGPQLWNGGDTGNDYLDSMPVPSGTGETPTGWRVVWDNVSGGSDTIHVYAVCASP